MNYLTLGFTLYEDFVKKGNSQITYKYYLSRRVRWLRFLNSRGKLKENYIPIYTELKRNLKEIDAD